LFQVMIARDDMPPEIMRMITSGLPYRDRLHLRHALLGLRNIEVPWELQTVKLHKFQTTLKVAVTITEHLVSPTFLSFYEDIEEITGWRASMTAHSVTYTLKFAFPLPSNDSIFPRLTILHHLDMDKTLPIYVENDALESVAALFAGCSIEKVSLVFDKMSMRNLNQVPRFVSTVRASHVEFVLQSSAYADIIAPFTRDEIAAELVRAGVREITFSAVSGGGRPEGFNLEPTPNTAQNGQPIDFRLDFVPSLFEAGINRLTVNYNRMSPDDLMTLPSLTILMNRLAVLNKSLRLELTLSERYLPMRRLTNVHNQLLRRVVHVAEEPDDPILPHRDGFARVVIEHSI
ncbi:hypothetical protein PENTCL1PPCAC_4032, partial [Pristionchus entomophagus]